MKKIIFLFVMLVVSQATLADELVVVAEAVNGTYRIKYNAERTCNTKMTIQDDAGNVIFSEVIKNQCSFIRPYNLSQLPYSRYTVTASNEYGRKVTYVDHKAVEEAILKHKITKLKNDRYLLQIPQSEFSRARIVINGKEAELYANEITLKGDFACVYKIKGSAGDTVEFTVTPLR